MEDDGTTPGGLFGEVLETAAPAAAPAGAPAAAPPLAPGDLTPFFGTGADAVVGAAEVPADLETRANSAKLTLLRALAIISNTNCKLASVCLSSSAITAVVLTYFRLPWRVVCGHFTLPGFPYAIPHAWVHTSGMPSGDGITDITYTDAKRKIKLLGQPISIQVEEAGEEAVPSTYFPGPWNPANAGALSPVDGTRGVLPDPRVVTVDKLQQHARDIQRYLYDSRARTLTANVLRKALDGNTEITFGVPVAESPAPAP
jgi:hypothetical protein